MSFDALPGFRDFYPAELAERASIFQAWRAVAHRYGFVEYDGPPLEPLELYTRKSGEEIVGQLYAFRDKGDREVALRPEMTPTLARMVAARANALRKPIRWFSVPQLFRYERAQRGRLREHFQLNLDIVGEADVTADAELLAAAIDIMRELGLTASDVVARVSDRRILDALLLAGGVFPSELAVEQHPDVRAAVYAAIDKIGRDPADVIAERLARAGVPADAARRLFDVLALETFTDVRQRLAGHAAAAPLVEAFERYLDYLDALDVRDWVRFDLSIVRGLAYYTGIVFELFDAKGVLRAICGGGRYDNLLTAMGGPDLPALGFGMGDVVLGELLRERGLAHARPAALDYWVVTAGADPADTAEAMRVATRLRRTGCAVEYPLRAQSSSKQLKAAHAAGARFAVLLPARGADGERRATVRDLATGDAHEVRLDEWLAEPHHPTSA